MFLNWWRHGLKKANKLSARRKSRSSTFRPRLEALEDRCLLAFFFHEFTTPTTSSLPFGIATPSTNGDLWYASPSFNRVVRMTRSGAFVEVVIPTGASQPTDIVGGPDGNLWFTEVNGNKIGRVIAQGPSLYKIDEFTVPTANSQPTGITVGPDGALWFTEPLAAPNNDKIGRLALDGTFTEFTLPIASRNPQNIVTGPDGNLWFTEDSFAFGQQVGQIGRLSPNGGLTEFALPSGSTMPRGITSGPDGNLWFVEAGGNKIGRMRTDGFLSEFRVPTNNSTPTGITVGPDGNLWFTEMDANKLGRINPRDLTIIELNIPTPRSAPRKITVGPDGNLWFTESAFTEPEHSKIGELVMPHYVVTGADAGGGPRVRVFDALTGAVTLDFMAYDPAFRGGVRVAIGDITHTGIPAIVTAPGRGGGPDIRVFSLFNGQLIREFLAYDVSFTGGVNIAVGDVNGDGYDDIVTAADAGGGPHVKVFSGRDGSLLQSFFAYDPSFRGGVRLAVGDVDGDGLADIITAPGPGGGPHVKVFSGRNLSLLQSFMAYDPSFTGGVYVAAGDVDADGKVDIITGPGAGGGPQVKVFSGANGTVLRNFFAYPASFRGGVRVAAWDVDGNARADIITGAGPTGGPHVKVFDDTSLAVLDQFFAYESSFTAGIFVAAR